MQRVFNYNYKDLEYFTKRYGLNYKVYRVSDGAILKTKILDFSTNHHNIWSKDDVNFRIPEDEYKKYRYTILKDMFIMDTHEKGGWYSTPTGNWLLEKNEKYQAVAKFPILTIV